MTVPSFSHSELGSRGRLLFWPRRRLLWPRRRLPACEGLRAGVARARSCIASSRFVSNRWNSAVSARSKRRRRHIALTTRSARNSSIGPTGERFARTWLKRSSKALASSSGRTTSRVRSPCRTALRRTAATPSDVSGPAEWRALARLAAFVARSSSFLPSALHEQGRCSRRITCPHEDAAHQDRFPCSGQLTGGVKANSFRHGCEIVNIGCACRIHSCVTIRPYV
jgi:hypothetical protein